MNNRGIIALVCVSLARLASCVIEYPELAKNKNKNERKSKSFKKTRNEYACSYSKSNYKLRQYVHHK
jgi:hypothetical protein